MSATDSRKLNVPSVSGLTLFKMMPEFRRDALKTFTSLAERYGEVVRFSGLWTSFMLTNPPHIEHVLQTNSRNYRKGRIYWASSGRLCSAAT